MLLNDADKKKLIVELVGKIEEISKKSLGKYSERVQLEVIEKVLLPLCGELTKDDRQSLETYRLLLTREFERIQGRIEAQADKA